MRFYDTAVRGPAEFVPGTGPVRLYVCGVTPYDSAHLGHIFTFLTYDLLQRRLEDLGHEVRMVRNITDVDEPIFIRAAANGESYQALAMRETAAFRNVMQALNFREPADEPLASAYITEMSAAVERLLAAGHAYRLEQDVYFDVSTFKQFGNFSQFPEQLQLAFMADRGGDPGRPNKRQPLDFLLWRGVTDPQDEAAWESPLGRGRPGWHIECSVMSRELLGQPVDIHGGGLDLIFPHHECEIAQSESLSDVPFSRHWLHVAPLFRYGEKMSKSLGNLAFARDLIAEGDPAALRLALLPYHFRVGGEWRDLYWRQAQQLLAGIRRLVNDRDAIQTTGLLATTREALDTNLDTPTIWKALQAHVDRQGDADELRQTCELLGVKL